MIEPMNGIISQLQRQRTAIDRALAELQGVEEIEGQAARTRLATRRLRASSAQSDEPISIGDVELHPERRLVLKAGEPVHLTPTEFGLLHYLMAHAGLPITHAQLLHAVWGSEHVNQVEHLRIFVRQLRKKLEDDAGNPKYLLTDSRVGYRFIDPAQAPRTAAV
jgi:two-component system, OmpR family, KDP operon response regulator KdpE